jgi:geranylgeranyl pyrophosphate synthase
MAYNGPATTLVDPTVTVRFPDRFQGIFERLRPRFAPLLVEARGTLSRLPVRPELHPYYSYGVLKHAQPSFMLLPLMFLTLADHVRGVGPRHRRHLPWLMLAMEACAILDDTVDHTPYRSGRLSYPGRFGAASAAPFTAFLVTVVMERTAREEPGLVPLVTDLFQTLCSLETWEIGARYPALDEATLSHWLACRYGEVTPAVAYGLDGALLLHGEPRLPARVSTLFAEIFQDVDDLVNFAERRERAGENDDLKMGMVTHLLLAAVRNCPGIVPKVESLWAAGREAGEDRYASVASLVERHGIVPTVEKILADADECIAITPQAYRAPIEEMVLTFLDRLRRTETLRPHLDLRIG